MEIRFPEIALGNGYFANILFIFVHVLPFQKHHENRTWEDAEDDFFVVLDKVDKYDAISVPMGLYACKITVYGDLAADHRTG